MSACQNRRKHFNNKIIFKAWSIHQRRPLCRLRPSILQLLIRLCRSLIRLSTIAPTLFSSTQSSKKAPHEPRLDGTPPPGSRDHPYSLLDHPPEGGLPSGLGAAGAVSGDQCPGDLGVCPPALAGAPAGWIGVRTDCLRFTRRRP